MHVVFHELTESDINYIFWPVTKISAQFNLYVSPMIPTLYCRQCVEVYTKILFAWSTRIRPNMPGQYTTAPIFLHCGVFCTIVRLDSYGQTSSNEKTFSTLWDNKDYV